MAVAGAFLLDIDSGIFKYWGPNSNEKLAMRLIVFLLLATLAASAAQAGTAHDAAKSGDVSGITAALEAGADVNAEDDQGRQATALYYAAVGGHLEAVRLLIARGADVNRGAVIGGAPIINSAAYKRVEVLQLLLANGADPNSQYHGDTALHLAAQRGCMSCVKLLVEAGANVNAINNQREPPIHQALLNGHQEIADYLMVHGYVKPVASAISGKLATANTTKGKELFIRQCGLCHDSTPKMNIRTGPPLWGIVGRPRATESPFTYSDAMKLAGGSWGFEELNVFIADPTRTIPGIFMKAEGYQEVQDRADLIAYLRTLSDNPMPLPRQ